MVNRLFSRSRIRGVSFRHGRAPLAAGRSEKSRGASGSDFGLPPLDSFPSPFWNGPSAEDIRNSAPRPFKSADLHRLLGDFGRNELHTLVSEAVEQLVKLKQISKSIERLSPDAEPDRHFLQLEESSESSAHPLQDVGVEILRVQRLWKLRLEVLEMVAMAQDSLRSLHLKSSKKPQQREVGSAPRKK